VSKSKLMNLEEALVREINAEHRHVVTEAEKVKQSIIASVNAAIRCGLLLLKAKQDIRRAHGHGQWLIWIKNHLDCSADTCQLYMRLAKIKGGPITDLKEGISCLKDVMIEAGVLPAPDGHGLQERIIPDAFLSRSVRFVGQWREEWMKEIAVRPVTHWPDHERQKLKVQLEPLVLIYKQL